MTKLATPIRSSLRLDTVSSTETYVGEAAFGQSENNPAWRIKKLETVGTVLKILWADGNDDFNQVWADRTTLSYS